MHVNEYTPCDEKEYVRDSVFLSFQDCKRVLTLPNLYFSLEKMLLKDGKQVECCEYKKDIYDKQVKIAPAEIKLHHSDVGKLDVTKYDGVFLDLCGSFSVSAGKVLNRIRPGTNIVVTFLMRRESKSLQKILNLDDRENSYISLLEKYNVHVEKHINYGDRRSPMCVFFGIKS